MILISNNKLLWVEFSNSVKIKGSPLDVMEEVKKRIFERHRLLTMPISGNLRMVISPYRSVLLSEEENRIDNHSVMLVEDALERLKKTDFDSSPEFTRKDYMYMDREFIMSVLGKPGLNSVTSSL